MKTRIYLVLGSLFIIAIIYLGSNTTTAQNPALSSGGDEMVVAQSSNLQEPTRTRRPTITPWPSHTPRPTRTPTATLSMEQQVAATETAIYHEAATLRVFVISETRQEHPWHRALPADIRAASRQEAELIITIRESTERGSRSEQYSGCGTVYASVTVYTATIRVPGSSDTIALLAFRGAQGNLPFTMRGCSPPAGPPPDSAAFVRWVPTYTRAAALTQPPEIEAPQAGLSETLTVPGLFSLRYPEGWAALIVPEAGVVLATTESALATAALDPNTQSYLTGEVIVQVAYIRENRLDEAQIAGYYFQSFALGEPGFAVDEPQTLTISTGEANRHAAQGPYDQIIFFTNTSDGLLYLRIATAPGELVLWEPTALEILESVTFP